MAIVATILAGVTRFANLFFSCGLFHSSPEGLGTGETSRAGQAVVTRLSVLAAVDSIMCIASIRDQCALINVLASDTISSVTKRTLATLERAIGEACAS